MNKVTMIALPYAGGGSYCYNFLKNRLPGHVKLETLEYPGRGTRSAEPLVTGATSLIGDLLSQYQSAVSRTDAEKVVIYGHSMGAAMGVELLHAINNSCSALMPAGAIFSGQGAPRTIKRKALSALPETDLIDYFVSSGSLSEEAAAEPELMAYVLPVLRNDLFLFENYSISYSSRLNIPLSIVNGSDDTISQEQIARWALETTGKTDFYSLKGNHFFINQNNQFAGLLTNICYEL